MTDDQLTARAIAARIAAGWSRSVDIGPGWHGLLARLDEQLTEISPGYEVLQCKRKFGGLRFYARAEDSLAPDAKARFDELIRAAEEESFSLCEECGRPAERIEAWTLCAEHARQRLAPVRCEHWDEALGRAYGWHHHAGPHACDYGNHGDECPYWPAVLDRATGRDQD